MKADSADRHENREIILPDDTRCIVAVISDTHGKPHPNLFPVLEGKHPSLILHAGDIGDPSILRELEEVSRTLFVRGNTDPRGQMWLDSLTVHLKLGKSLQFDLLLLHVAMAHLRLRRETLNLLRQNPAGIVVFGHSHIPFIGTEGKIWLFNPGSAGPPRMRLPTTMGLIEISSGQLTFKHLDLNTGEPLDPRLKNQTPA